MALTIILLVLLFADIGGLIANILIINKLTKIILKKGGKK